MEQINSHYDILGSAGGLGATYNYAEKKKIMTTMMMTTNSCGHFK